MIRQLGMCVILLWSAPAAAQCDDIKILKKPAAMGQLDTATLTCLEAARDNATLTRRENVSNLLIANAFAQKDDATWEKHVKVHLSQIDSSDSETMTRYAQHLLKNDRAPEALKWAESAAEHSYSWPEDELQDNLYELQRLKTRTLWAIYESFAEEGGMRQRAALGQVQLASVEWIQLSAKNKRDMSEAMDFCIRAGWNQERCQQQADL